MKTVTTNPKLEISRIIFPERKSSPVGQLGEGQARCRKICLSFAPRREACLTRLALRAAVREAELADWLASGGDYLSSMHQPIV